MAITYYASNKILDLNFGSTAYSVPGTLYVGLSTTAIAANGTGSTEPVAMGYARVAVTNNKTNWDTAANGTLSNLTAVEFAISTGNWGTITHVFLADAASAGNIWFSQALASSKNVQTDTVVRFEIGAIDISMTN